jgi:hypothetical protein
MGAWVALGLDIWASAFLIRRPFLYMKYYKILVDEGDSRFGKDEVTEALQLQHCKQ